MIRVLLTRRRYLTLVRASAKLRSGSRARVIGLRTVHVAAIMGYALYFYFHIGGADVGDFCGVVPANANEQSCNAWPDISQTACDELTALTPGWRSHPGMHIPTTYDCHWVNQTMTRAEVLLTGLPGGGTCRKGRCRLFLNARSIALEFGGLFLFATCARRSLAKSTE